MKRNVFCAILAIMFVVSMLAGCGSATTSESVSSADTEQTAITSEETETVPETPQETEDSSAAEAAEPSENMEESAEVQGPESIVSYPLGQESETITYWTTIPGNQTSILPNGYNDHFLKETVQEALGVKIDITSVSQIGMGDNTDFNLMIATGAGRIC